MRQSKSKHRRRRYQVPVFLGELRLFFFRRRCLRCGGWWLMLGVVQGAGKLSLVTAQVGRQTDKQSGTAYGERPDETMLISTS